MRYALLLILVTATVVRAQHPATRQVAVTFDDVPGVQMRCTPGAARAVNRKLLDGLARHRVPAAALVVTGPGRCAAAELDRLVDDWLTAGHEVGSHTRTHRDINRLSLAAYLSDVDAAHARLDPMLRRRGQRLQFFRHPFLHAGDTPAKKEGLARHLKAKGYQIAAVTVDNQEWVFADAYTRAQARQDSAMLRRILPAYLAHLDSSFAYYEELSQRVFQRQIPQILLLHANELNADHLDDVVRMMRARGYRFIPMSTALQDPAYRHPDQYVGTNGISWLQRWALARKIPFRPEPREPAWLTQP